MIVLSLASGILGNLWNALLILAVTPVFVRNMGVEAYGLISLIAVLQVAVGSLDFGLASTITREIARAGEENEGDMSRLMGSLSAIYWTMAVAVGAVLYCASGDIQMLLGPAKFISVQDMVLAIELIALFLAVRWPVAYFAGVIAGKQQFGLLNALKSGSLTVRWLGGAILAALHRDILVLLCWFGLTAVMELLAMAAAAKRVFPALPLRPRMDVSSIKGVWRFSASMYAISLLAMLLTQVDRFAVGGYLGLDELGYYSIAYSLAAGATLLQTALNAVALPAYASGSNDLSREALLRRYEKFSHITGWLMAPLTAALILFGKAVVAVWIDAPTAEQTAFPIALLASGFCLNAVYSNTYLLGVACGKPGFFLKANTAGLVLYGLALVMGLASLGIVGAALAWLVLNMYYLGVVTPLAHRYFRLGGSVHWLARHSGIFVLLALFAFAISSVLTASLSAIWRVGAGLTLGMLLYLMISMPCLEPSVRRDIYFFLRRFGPVRLW